jgi:hypothetical protein
VRASVRRALYFIAPRRASIIRLRHLVPITAQDIFERFDEQRIVVDD